ncbi:MAG: hypothetical protein JXA24_05210 [Proteobacteria bacterium]|nr:hypothetical protein [Pseudomonadota bacterium]
MKDDNKSWIKRCMSSTAFKSVFLSLVSVFFGALLTFTIQYVLQWQTFVHKKELLISKDYPRYAQDIYKCTISFTADIYSFQTDLGFIVHDNVDSAVVQKYAQEIKKSYYDCDYALESAELFMLGIGINVESDVNKARSALTSLRDTALDILKRTQKADDQKVDLISDADMSLNEFDKEFNCLLTLLKNKVKNYLN